MTEQPPARRDGRMDNLASGVSVAAKIALLLGLAGGLFVTVVLSYADPDRQLWGIAIGGILGIIAAVLMTVRGKRHDRSPR